MDNYLGGNLENFNYIVQLVGRGCGTGAKFFTFIDRNIVKLCMKGLPHPPRFSQARRFFFFHAIP